MESKTSSNHLPLIGKDRVVECISCIRWTLDILPGTILPLFKTDRRMVSDQKLKEAVVD